VPPVSVLGKNHAFRVDLVEPLVDARVGEIVVTLKNKGERNLPGGRLTLRDLGGPQNPAFAVTPSSRDGGYQVDAVPLGGTPRAFCLRPLQAEVGRKYPVEVAFTPCDGKALTLVVAVAVEARPEVYAAIGAIDVVRRNLLAGYEHLVAAGKQAHQAQGTILPGGRPIEAAPVALGPGSFQFVMEALELGLRVLRVPAQRAARTPDKGDDSSGGAPSS